MSAASTLSIRPKRREQYVRHSPVGAEAAAVPKWAEGNWRASDGSNRWVCGFLPTTVLYDRDFWSYDRIARKGKTLEVRLGKPGDERTLWLREGKGGRMLLSTDGRTFDTLGAI